MQRPSGHRELYDFAQEQGGYFTAKQAALCGYTANKRNCHVIPAEFLRMLRPDCQVSRPVGGEVIWGTCRRVNDG